MKSLLNALNDGRLIELPDNDKTMALEYLAALIEAIPDIHFGDEGVAERVLAREQSYNTGIGKGWACPHARFSGDGEVVCAVGWSPDGIDYGAPDGIPVRFIVMYFVPEAQKNSYLKEISSLAKAITTLPALQDLEALTDLAEARHRLLDAIGMALESTAPDARARMIRLESRHAQSEIDAAAPVLVDGLLGAFTPLSVISLDSSRFFVLGQDDSLVELLEKQEDLPARLLKDGSFTHADLHVVARSSANYKPDRTVHDCICYSVKKS
jgi:mannitol/fructose-specific phosphotransferase system IIA component (Ntr-type)